MIDRAAATENPDPLAGPTPGEPADATPSADPPPRDEPTLAALEQRVRRLEEALEALQDTGHVESRVAARVLERVGRERPGALRESAAIVLDAGRQFLPVAAGAIHAQAAALEARADAAPGPRPWLIADLYADVRTLARMARDPLYRTVWLGRALVPLGLLAAIVTSGVWLYLVPGFGFLPGVLAGLIVKVVDLLLAFVLCKVLQREIRRYRATLPDPSAARQSQDPVGARAGQDS